MSAAPGVLLVGSIPLDTSEAVFEMFGRPLGAQLSTLPDGETGPRRHWISRVHYQVFAGHPDFEVLRRPAPDDGIERLNPRNAGDSWLFKVRDGVSKVRFGDPGWRLGYAREAIQSYFVFRSLRDKGALPAHLRFQVSLASVNSVLPPRVFPVAGDLDRIREGYEAALRAEIETIVAHIPAHDLAIQFDCATEVQDAYGGIAQLDPATMIERNCGQIRRLSQVIPSEASLGIHLCFGTLGGWPRFSPDDLGQTVVLANAMVEQTERSIEWLHIPTLDRSDLAFYAALADLRPRSAQVYLGMIHHMDTFATRLRVARQVLPGFGLAAYCGLGRSPASELPGVLAEHLSALAQASA